MKRSDFVRVNLPEIRLGQSYAGSVKATLGYIEVFCSAGRRLDPVTVCVWLILSITDDSVAVTDSISV